MFSRIGNLIYRSSESKNSASYVNRQSLNLTLDPSGTDFIEYSTDSAYFTEAHSLIPNSESQITTTALKLQDSATNNLFLSTLGDFTLCVKHKLNAPSTSSDIFSHYFANPQYDISFAEPYIRENSPFNVIVSKASNGPVEYEVSGNLITSHLTNGDISGTISTVESVLPYTLNTGTAGKDFVFLLKNLDVSLNAPIYSQYYVTTSTNILGETVFAFSPTGTEGTYNNQLDLSFGANSKMIFNVSNKTMTDISLVFGTTVDDSDSINESVVTRTNDLVILDISAGYDGSRLVYFEDTSAGMGYVSSGGSGGNTNIEPTVLWYNFDISNGNTIANDATGSSLGDAIMTRSSIVTDVSKTGTGSLLCVRDSGQMQYVTLPSLTLPSDFTMCFWHKMTPVSGFANNIYLLYFMGVNTNATYNSQYAIEIEVNYGNFDILLNHSGGASRYTYGTYPNDNAWHHLMFIKSSTESTFKVYIDNSEKPPDKTVNMGAFSTSTYNSHYISGRPDLLTSIDNYHMGGHTDDYRFYSKALDDTERDTVYNYAPIQIATYTVDVSNSSLFRLDSGDGNGFVEKLPVTFNDNTTYIFDQSHASNANNTLVIGTAPDVSYSIVSSGLTIMGTPGQPGAYTKYVANGSTTVYYFSYQTSNMGYNPTP